MKSTDKVVIVGAGGHGKVVLDILLENKIDVLGFIDEDRSKHGKKVNGLTILGDLNYLKEKKEIGLALGIGNNSIRFRIYQAALLLGVKVVSVVHPRAIVARDVVIGVGSVIMPGAVVNTGTVMKEGVVVNTGATVDHDCCLEGFCQVWPGAHLAGTVTVGEGSYVGTGASVIQNIKIGKNVMIGAGAAVVSNIPDGVIAVGVPAKVIKENIK